MINEHSFHAFADEMQKISASRSIWRLAQSRKGRRPMRISTLLRKDKEGTLYKHKLSAPTEQATLNYQEIDPGRVEGSQAIAKKKRGDVPSRDDPAGRPVVEPKQEIRYAGPAPDGIY